MEELDDTTSETTKPNYLTLLQQINKLSSLSTNLNTMNITEIETVFNNITENIDRILDQMVFQKSSMFLITTLNIIVRISAVDGSNLFISQQTFQSMFKKLNHLIKCIRDEKDYSPVIASDILDAIFLNLVKDDFIEICFRQVLSNETVTTDDPEPDELEKRAVKYLLRILLQISSYPEHLKQLIDNHQFCIIIESLANRPKRDDAKRIWCNIQQIISTNEQKKERSSKIYISYDRTDEEFCKEFVKELRKRTTIPIWVDYENVDLSDDMWEYVSLNIISATVVITLAHSTELN
ncbi:unnamed protein product [Adineta steineri]|uniref:TIR domain-containing protein n=1 Tax=Adineta steineri TaxID=433720 RepID=A0A814F4K3_9BILA|nr:unnamed protein product [Adineta steineri]